MFNDKEVDKKVKLKLGIFDNIEPKESDLDKITEILISNLNVRGENINTDLSEIGKLKKLKILGLKGFNINEEIVDIINRFPELVQLKLYECYSQDAISIDIDTLKNLILDHCLVNLSNVKLPENVAIINCESIDISSLEKNENVRNLEIKNTEIINSNSFRNIKNLKFLNVDGSILDYDEILDELKFRKISISYMNEYNPLR